MRGKHREIYPREMKLALVFDLTKVLPSGARWLLEYLIESFLYNKDMALIHVNSIN